MGRRGFLAGATVDLYTGGRAAVTFDAPPGRWPEHEAADRLLLVVALPAIAMNAVEPSGVNWLQGRLRQVALMLSAPSDAVYEPEVVVVTAAGPGDLRVELRLTQSPVGPSPSLVDRSVGIQSLALAMEAVALVGFEGAPADERLAAALAIEGVLAWFYDASPGHRPPAQAMGYALAYAAARFEGVGRPAPAALTEAVSA
jgi:hypothetical protein